MNLQVSGKLCGTVTAPASKSDLHRLLIASSLCGEATALFHCTQSDDRDATAGVLRAAGASVIFSGEKCIVRGISKLPNSDEICCDCGESGSTLRFLVPVLAALGLSATFTGAKRLGQRPMKPLVEQLQSHGVLVSMQNPANSLPMGISCKLLPGEYSLSGGVSSQYITGLLFALPLLSGESKIFLTSPLESSSYVSLTLATLARFGIKIEAAKDGWLIAGNQVYTSPATAEAEGDWSAAAFWLCAGAMTATDSNPLIVEGVDTSSLQGDREVCSVLERMGAKLKIEKTRVTCTGGNLHGVTIDGSQIPDIIPILSVVAAVALGESRIINAQRLRLKESDRLSAMAESLSAIGAKLTQTEDGLIIGGSESLDGGMVTSSNDHRIAMAMAVASLRCKAPVVIKQAECVAKSYPDFYQDFKMLGGKADVVNLG